MKHQQGLKLQLTLDNICWKIFTKEIEQQRRYNVVPIEVRFVSTELDTHRLSHRRGMKMPRPQSLAIHYSGESGGEGSDGKGREKNK